MKQRTHTQAGFTYMELVVVVAVLMGLSAITFLAVTSVRERVFIRNASTIQNELTVAAELYRRDMGFYPPDVNRGWDPGLSSTTPSNPDNHGTSGADCSHCPEDWEDIVAAQWQGPYIKNWPQLTPWGGKYDYNYWAEDVDRYGCTLEAGLYIGIQGDYDNNNQILDTTEQRMLDLGLDSDSCLNGEAQLVLWTLE